jgi:glutamyl-tRNA synthetase
MKSARTRFAVSPTGFMHVGGVRNALFDWLVAKQSGGQFILRIEDTDQAREVPGAVAHIIETLHWLGLEWDEGPEVGGPEASYVQSERLDIYREWAQKLIDAGKAYADPYTTEQVDAFRVEAKAAKKPFLFRNYRPENPPTWDGSQPLRLHSEPKAYSWNDAVMGKLSAGAEAVDDFVLMKSDGFPTYNFCHIIDDHLMHVTHIIRSQEFVASMPRYLNLYDALGIVWPTFGHLPWIMGPDGNKKLSKRDGAKDVMDYRREGYMPEAILNFLASLGWNDGTEQEIFTRDELVTKFSLDRVQRSGARFDENRLLWMNGSWIRSLSLDALYDRTKGFWPETSESYDEAYKKQVLGLVQERLKYFAELPELTNFFFEDLPLDMELIDGNKQLKKFDHAELKTLLEQAKANLEQSDFTVADLTECLNALLETTGQKPGVLFSLIRVATTQAPFSPSLAETLNVIDKDVVQRRINTTLASLTA